MNIEIKQVSSLDKIRTFCDAKTFLDKKILLKGEVFSFQQALFCSQQAEIKVSLRSPLKDFITLYEVKKAPMDFACFPEELGDDKIETDDDYITKEPSLMPDLLIPLKNQNYFLKTINDFAVVWAELKLPDNILPGKYEITIEYDVKAIYNKNDVLTITKTISIEVLDLKIPKQDILVTQWFYNDCIASAHKVKIYSDEHFELIDKYIKEAVSLGMNMILTPVITPPLDTKEGALRPNTQLVKIEKKNDLYYFDFSLLKRFVLLALKNGIKHFEICHLFSQWGLKYSPNIYVTEDGKEERLFGWHVPANDESYKEFLSQFLPALTGFLKAEGIYENCYFHISDEPTLEHLSSYRYAHDVIKPYLKDAKIMDALSNVDFYDTGLVSIPVTANNHIEPFLERKCENQWTYYCCVQYNKVSNRFMSMPSYRNRILGLQLYKFGIKGFLHWGFNFYYSQLSLYEINPYVTTSSDRSFPSGDPFLVYPGKDGPLPSVRGKVFKNAIQDVSVCKLLEEFIGKENVVKFIEKNANMEITFFEYPRSAEFLLKLDDAIKEELRKYIK